MLFIWAIIWHFFFFYTPPPLPHSFSFSLWNRWIRSVFKNEMNSRNAPEKCIANWLSLQTFIRLPQPGMKLKRARAVKWCCCATSYLVGILDLGFNIFTPSWEVVEDLQIWEVIYFGWCISTELQYVPTCHLSHTNISFLHVAWDVINIFLLL